MIYYRYKSESEIVIYPLVCFHLGVPQADLTFIKEHIERILDDPNGVAVYMGDAGECNIRESKGDVYSQTIPPGKQMDEAEELLSPLGDKLLWGIRGNHGNRIYKATGVDWDAELCRRLGIFYSGAACFMRLQANRSHYDLYFHHGASSSINLGGKVNASLKFNHTVQADAVFTAHTHTLAESPIETIAYIPMTKQLINWRYKHNYICGCGYDSRSGYAEDKGYAPILPGYLGVTFYGERDSPGGAVKKQRCELYRARV